MTTEELFEKLKKHGFDIRKENELACNIYYIFYKGLCCVQLFPTLEFEETFVVTSGFKDLKRSKKEVLYKILTKYAATPVEGHNSKRYFRYRLKRIADHRYESDVEFLKYSKDKKIWFLGDYRNNDICQTIFEENDPLLDEVNLEIFDAIELDVERCGLHD